MADQGWRDALQSLSGMKLDEEGVEEVYSSVKLLVQLSLQIHNRREISELDVYNIGRILEILYSWSTTPSQPLPLLHYGTMPPKPLPTLGSVCVETLKLLRNLCAEVPSNQLWIIDHPRILSLSVEFAKDFTVNFDPSAPPVTKVALQLLGNVCVGQTTGQEAVWKVAFPQLFRAVFDSPSVSGLLGDMACMLLHYCTMHNSQFKLQVCSLAPDVICDLTCSLANPTQPAGSDSEWSCLFMESLLSTLPLRTIWECYDLDHRTTASCMTAEKGYQELRLIMLKFALTTLKLLQPHPPSASQLPQPHPSSSTPKSHTSCQPQPTEPHPLPCQVPDNSRTHPQDQQQQHGIASTTNNISFIMDAFHSSSLSLLNNGGAALRKADSHSRVQASSTTYPLDFPQIRTCHTLLTLLCVPHKHILQLMRDNSTLLDDVLALLHKLSSLDGSLSSAKNRSKLQASFPTAEQQEKWVCHPLYGFKRDLVQLLGNLLYQSHEVQDRVREKSSVPLILNQCSIDHRNPYIGQWAVFAIHNLCEGNPANQQLIASLKMQGVCPLDEETLRAAGGEVEVGHDGEVRIKRTEGT